MIICNPFNSAYYRIYLINYEWIVRSLNFCFEAYKVGKLCFYRLSTVCNIYNIYICKLNFIFCYKYIVELNRLFICCKSITRSKWSSVYRNCCVICKQCIIRKVNNFYTTTKVCIFCGKFECKNYFLTICVIVFIPCFCIWVCFCVMCRVFYCKSFNCRLFRICINKCTECVVWIVNFVIIISSVCYPVFYCKANFVSCITIYVIDFNIFKSENRWGSSKFRVFKIFQYNCVIFCIKYVFSSFIKLCFTCIKLCCSCKFYIIWKLNNFKTRTCFVYID